MLLTLLSRLASSANDDTTEPSVHRRHSSCPETSSWLSRPVTGAHRAEDTSTVLANTTAGRACMQELRAQAQQLLIGQEIPWRGLRDISQQLQAVRPNADSPWLHEACKGSQLILSAPPKREKSKELLERLSRLQQQVDQHSYNSMVAEVTQQVILFQLEFRSCSSMSQAGKFVIIA